MKTVNLSVCLLCATSWFVEDVIKYHRTLESYISVLFDAKFTLDALKEPNVIDSALTEKREIAIFNCECPLNFKCISLILNAIPFT